MDSEAPHADYFMFFGRPDNDFFSEKMLPSVRTAITNRFMCDGIASRVAVFSRHNILHVHIWANYVSNE